MHKVIKLPNIVYIVNLKYYRKSGAEILQYSSEKMRRGTGVESGNNRCWKHKSVKAVKALQTELQMHMEY